MHEFVGVQIYLVYFQTYFELMGMSWKVLLCVGSCWYVFVFFGMWWKVLLMVGRRWYVFLFVICGGKCWYVLEGVGMC